MNASTAASAGPVPPIIRADPFDEPLVSDRITPEPCSAIWRAATFAVRNCVVRPAVTGRIRSATDMSTSGMPWTSPREIRLNETSIEPADEATARAVDDAVLVVE